MDIETLKQQIVEAWKSREYDKAISLMRRLDQVWTDDRAAYAFYTELEQMN